MTRRQLSIVAVLGHVALAAWCIVTGVQHSLDPGHYHRFHSHPQDFVPPIDEIAWWAGAIAIEVTVASWVVALMRSTAAACAVLATFAGLGVLGMAPLAMHAPPYYGMHIGFLMFSTVWLSVIGIVAKLALRPDAPAPA